MGHLVDVVQDSGGWRWRRLRDADEPVPQCDIDNPGAPDELVGVSEDTYDSEELAWAAAAEHNPDAEVL